MLNTLLSPVRAACASRRCTATLLTTCALLLAGISHAAKVADSVRAWREQDAIIVQAQAELDAPLETAWHVLTDYGRYAAFIPDLKSSRVLSRSGNTAIVEQKGEAGFFFFHFPVEVTLHVTELPDSSVNSHAISGTFKEMTGSYKLSEGDGMVRFTYQGRIVPAVKLPPLVGVPALRAAVERQFLALAREIRRAAANAQDSREPR